MEHACFCRGVVCRGVPGINTVIIGAVCALCPRCPIKLSIRWPWGFDSSAPLQNSRKALAEAALPGTAELKLSGYLADAAGVAAFAELMSRAPALRALDLTLVSPMPAEAWDSVPPLQSLALGCVDWGGAEGLAALRALVARSCRSGALRRLRVAHTALGDAGLTALAETLVAEGAGPGGLAELALDAAQVADAAPVCRLLEALPLASLSLVGNDLNGAAARALAAAVRRSRSLRELRIGHNKRLGVGGVGALVEAVEARDRERPGGWTAVQLCKCGGTPAAVKKVEAGLGAALAAVVEL